MMYFCRSDFHPKLMGSKCTVTSDEAMEQQAARDEWLDTCANGQRISRAACFWHVSWSRRGAAEKKNGFQQDVCKPRQQIYELIAGLTLSGHGLVVHQPRERHDCSSRVQYHSNVDGGERTSKGFQHGPSTIVILKPGIVNLPMELGAHFD